MMDELRESDSIMSAIADASEPLSAVWIAGDLGLTCDGVYAALVRLFDAGKVRPVFSRQRCIGWSESTR